MQARRYRTFFAVMLFLSINLFSCASAPEVAQEEQLTLGSDERAVKARIYVNPNAGKRLYQKVAVMPFRAPVELAGASMSDLFATDLLYTHKYELVERSQMAQVLNESELSLAGLSTAKAMEVGNMLGADGVVIGTVDEYGTVAQRGRSYPVVGMSARLIDCATGKVVWSVDMAGRAESADVTLPQQARRVVHSMVGTLYAELQKTR